jgi:hypothetical protein
LRPKSTVSAVPRVAPTAAPISSLKYGKCHWSGASTTPSSEMNRPPMTFLKIVLPEIVGEPCGHRVRRREPDELIDGT